MKKNYQYDVAVSCAEEDIPVAEKIALSLVEKNITYYLYTEHKAQHWGENIFKISLDKYGVEARFVLMLISKDYIRKHWSDIERQIMQTAERVGEAYILPLRLDDTPVDGLGSNIAFVKWKNDPEEIADLILKKIGLKPEQPGACPQPISKNKNKAKKMFNNNGNMDNTTVNF